MNVKLASLNGFFVDVKSFDLLIFPRVVAAICFFFFYVVSSLTFC